MRYIIDGYVNGTVPEYQVSAFFMATYFRGMTPEETNEFTRLMLHSGIVVDLSHVPGIKVDKHSTGGVGDKISLPLAPIVAACGVPVPMISGRGLGHTGGTLDKLESIPGFRTDLTIDEYKRVIAEIGVVMIGQTAEIAPADKKMYALRDVTSTVECIPLIAGSIMSKKLAEGIDALVLDVKTGRGAFMQSFESAAGLAQTLVGIGTSFGKRTVGFITDMNQPLGYAIGNWNEVVESVECLQGREIPDVMELTYTLGGAMVWLGGKAGTLKEGIDRCKDVVTNGKAFETFLQLVRHQSGDVSFILDPGKYPRSKYSETITASVDGFITSIDSLELGFSGILLGAGRRTVDEQIDPKAGIMLKKKAGDAVIKGEVIAEFHTDRKEIVESVRKRIFGAFSIGGDRPAVSPLIISMVDADGLKKYAP
jgi:pyrimidine-nucleoside phosphorylase